MMGITDDFSCPYCGEGCDTELYEPEVTHEHECGNCGKTFCFDIRYDPVYSEWKAECLNGGKHKYKHIIGWPSEYFDHKFRCEHCQNEITVPEWNEEKIRYSTRMW